MDGSDDAVENVFKPETWWSTKLLQKASDKMFPDAGPEAVKQPAEFVDETSKHRAEGEAKKRKKMLAQSVITKDWDAPVLGNVGQL